MFLMRFISLVLTLLLFIACRKSDLKFEKVTETYSLNSHQFISIKNIQDKSILIDIDINGSFALSLEVLVEKILDEGEEGEEDLIKAWRYVAYHLTFDEPVSQKLMYNDPLLIYNSIGYGFCDDFATLLCSIYRQMGYESRVVNINDHVVTEVKKDNKWQMFDAMHYVYYFNKNGQIASVDELYNDTSLITSPSRKIDYEVFTNKENYFYIINRYSDLNSKRYTQRKPEVFNFSTNLLEAHIDLPPQVTIEFPVVSTMKDVRVSLHDSSVYEQQKYIKYILPKGFQGTLKTPFLISSIQGDAEIELNHNKILLDGFDLKLNYDRLSQLPLELKVLKAKSDIVIYALINELLLNDSNEVQVNYASSEDPLIQVRKSFSSKFEKDIKQYMVIYDYRKKILEYGNDFEKEFYKNPFKTNKDLSLMVFRFLDFIDYKTCFKAKESVIKHMIEEKKQYPNQAWDELLFDFEHFKNAMIHYEEVIISGC